MISVIIPVYNAESTLRRCLDSILNQLYSSLEIILVDDGSKDNSGRICDEYGEQDDRIIVIHQGNKGVSLARNRGLDIAKGEYVGFVDSDDYIDPDYFKILLDNMGKSKTDICFSALEEVPNIAPSTLISNKNDLVSLIIGQKFGNNAGPYNKLFKNSIIGSLRFDKDIFVGEDTLFDVEYAKKCRNGVFVNKVMYHYDQRTSSSSYMSDPSKLFKYLTYAESRKKMLLDTSTLSDKCREMLIHSYLNSILNCYYQSRYFHNQKEERRMCHVMKEALKTYRHDNLPIRQQFTYWMMGYFPSIFPFWNAINTRL